MTYRAVKATSPTIGRPGPDSARPYRWRRNPDWYPVVNVTAKTARAYERERLAAIREALS